MSVASPTRNRLLLLGAWVAALGACAPEEGARSEPPREPSPSAAAFVETGLLPIGGTRAEIQAALGEPERVTRRVVPNRHVPGVMDTLFVLDYPGLAAHLHRPGIAGAVDLLSEVDVLDDRYLRFSSPSIGTTLQDLEVALGPPDEIDGESFSYACGSCEPSETYVRFMIFENRVREVRFHYYVD